MTGGGKRWIGRARPWMPSSQPYALYNRSEGEANSSFNRYEDKLRGFLRWVEGKGYSAHLSALTADLVRESILHLQGKAEK